jgi:isoleucyl-tRNA synthetase
MGLSVFVRFFVHPSKKFPADFIAEGVDQTRGWFYTLHAIGALVLTKLPIKYVVSSLVLDKNGQKCQTSGMLQTLLKRLEYGPDATRWYMISNTG